MQMTAPQQLPPARPEPRPEPAGVAFSSQHLHLDQEDAPLIKSEL